MQFGLRWGQRTGRRSLFSWWHVVLPGLWTLVLGQILLSGPNALRGVTEYDDGVYIGAALRLMHGALPYRDFVFLHPPGIVLIVAPLASLAGVIGSGAVLSISREITIVVSSANPVLAGLAMRHRGRRAMMTAGVAMALFPMAPDAEHTLLLEPYLVFFCLLGVCALFSSGSLASGRRLLLAGVALGFAMDVKIWGAVVAGVAVLFARRDRRPLVTLIAGMAIGFAIPVLPFFLSAPGRFVHDVIVTQVGRTGGTGATPLISRLADISGLGAVGPVADESGIMVLLIVLAVSVIGATIWLGRRSMLAADWFFLETAVTTTGIMFLPETVYPHYGYFSAAFLALVAGTVLDLSADILALPRQVRLRPVRIGLLALALVWVTGEQVDYGREVLQSSYPARPLSRIIPAGACVLSDSPADLVASGMFYTVRHCPLITDPYGTLLADGPPDASTPAGPEPRSFVAEWTSWLFSADFMVEHGQYSEMVPWTPALKAWFTKDYRLVGQWSDLRVYQHALHDPPPPAS